MDGLYHRQTRLARGGQMPTILVELILLMLTMVPQAAGSTPEVGTGLYEVRHLVAQPDFREVRLRWETDGGAPESLGFLVHYCELQPWGAYRCKVKAVDGGGGREAVQGGPGGGRVRLFSSVVSGLRMDTNYTFEVRPAAPQGAAAKARGQTIAVATRGFSARATLCLPEASEVEVVTGPHFGGRVAAEGAAGSRCSLDGDARSARAVYVLRVDHAACGGARNATAVTTYVTVQESAAILTHSTRRFLVICSFQPDTLTVRAGIRLPVRDNEVDNEVEASGAAGDGGADEGAEVARVRSAILPYADADVDAALQAADVALDADSGVRAARLLHHRHVIDDLDIDARASGHSNWQLTLMLVLTSAGLVGCALSAWWFSPSNCRRPPELADDGSSLSAYENLTNSLRDAASVSSGSIGSGGRCTASECDADGVITIRLGSDSHEPHVDAASIASAGCHCVHGGATAAAASAPPHEPCITLEDASQSEA
ncbi:uncharacterized protein LOC126335153 [Schistocerca gregaria]|uniref:uncharacterized protein LOC126335153 n=1 Tax=Schistocerca gregaria TaxID=7010 RepID=UPI00211F400E|nr:uncharacterized protein LOC126335153 [Schistocerca gregaria]XP_049854082.1 uncharacterized protein LOC126335153 [Schistocerca gregaria]XP_049854083.1 uncharacterized protein LOC126335153 [Schistocerca gregaria]